MTADELRRVVEQRCGAKAALSYVAPVRHQFGDVVWEGSVHVFELDGHKTVPHAYAWSTGFGSNVRTFVVLHGGGILGPAHAVRAVLMGEADTPRF